MPLTHSLTHSLTLALLVALGSAGLPAQAGGDPHVAPLAPGFHLNIGTPTKVSPLMNEPDGIWNMGEAPEGPDKGGVLDRDLTASSTAQPTFVPLLPGSGWQSLASSPPTLHYVGSFRNQATSTHPDDELRASFHVVAPATIEPGMYDPIVPGVQSVRSTLRVFGDGGGSALQLLSSVPVGEPGNPDFPGYGTCGIAVADLSEHQLDLGKVVIVTTLSGELIVFAVEGATINPQPLFRLAVEGAIGVLNSIVVADLDPVDSKPELYLAGSAGIRRFDFQ